MKKLITSIYLILSIIFFANGQSNSFSSSEILQSIKKLNNTGTALYVAAHPDDENTMLITWLSKERMVRTAYFSFTRGDGGQNLIGTEQGEATGLLRTQELLQARSVDGGEQYFSRANDFGYTKTTEEALATWGKELVLGDLVYAIRSLRPDVIITRFPPDDRAGHGHHSASAVMAAEAFKLAGDKNAYPEQLDKVSIWQPKRLVWNAYNRGFTNTPPEDAASYVTAEIGGYNTNLGLSYGEIGAAARSMHKSQGFGMQLQRGERTEFLTHTDGEPAKTDIFDGVNLTWSKVNGGEAISGLINEIYRNFQAESPQASVPMLIQLYKLLLTYPKDALLTKKIEEVKSLILRCSGIFIEANAADYAYAPTDSINLKVSIYKRTAPEVKIKNLQLEVLNFEKEIGKSLPENQAFDIPVKLAVPADAAISQPYWLASKHPLGSYQLTDEKNRTLPFGQNPNTTSITLNFDQTDISFTIPIQYKYADPSYGEKIRPLEIRPAVSITPTMPSLLFTDKNAQELKVTIKSNMDAQTGDLTPKLPAGWEISPKTISFSLPKKYDEEVVSFQITPVNNPKNEPLKLEARVQNKTFDKGLSTIAYNHIPTTTFYPEAEVSLVNVDLKTKGKTIGYVMGAGDEVPKALSQMGYTVKLINESDFIAGLPKMDALIIGIRAYNTLEWLPFYHQKLIEFMNLGGNVICQYQTSRGNDDFLTKMGPYPFMISRDRVSQEDAEVRILNPAHPVLNKPNKITDADFEGWVQERGLYFADKYQDHYEAIFSMNDTNESPKEGSLIIAKQGKGNYIFTGLSFFRELPAGVPGAYRLLANLIAL